MMPPLVALAAGLVPELIRPLAGDKTGAVAASVAQAVQDVTGTTDPVAAQQTLTDPAAAANLRVQLAQIAVEQSKAQSAEDESRRQAELETIRQSLANTQGARGTLLGLVQGGSSIAWGAPVVSIIVTLGFFIFMFLMVFNGIRVPSADTATLQVINIIVGALTTGFATVVNFWLGSSQSSRYKDDTVRAMQETQAKQTSDALSKLASVSSNVAAHTLAVSRAPAFAPAPAALAAASAAPPPPAPREDAAKDAEDDNFDRCLPVTLSQEGGFSDNRNDPGAATNFGITQKTLEEWRGKPVTVEDVRNLTEQEATEIYRANYWLPARCDDLPPGIDLMVFDFGVNAGPRTSVRLLQRTVGVSDDGSAGPATLRAVKAANARILIDQLAEARLQYCRGLPSYAELGRGWSARVAQVKSAATLMLA